MTRQEFIDDVTSWDELIDFCNDNGCGYCDDVYSEYSRDEYIDDDLVDMARNADGWSDLLDSLNNIPTGYDFYRRDDYGEWRGLGDYEFSDYKSDVLEWGDDAEIWDEDEEEDGEEPWYVDDEEFTPPDESISIADLMTSCNSKLQKISDDAEKAAAEDEKAFQAFVGRVEVTETMTVAAISIDDYDLPNF